MYLTSSSRLQSRIWWALPAALALCFCLSLPVYGQQTPSSAPTLELSGTPIQRLQQVLRLSSGSSQTLIQLWQRQIADSSTLAQQSADLNKALEQSKAQQQLLDTQLSSLQAQLQEVSKSLSGSQDSYRQLSASYDSYRKATLSVQSDYRLRSLEWGAAGLVAGFVLGLAIGHFVIQ